MTIPSARLFGSVELAVRLERAEVGLLRDAAAAASRRDPTTQARAITIAGGAAIWAGHDQPFNKVAGLGFGGAVDPGDLAVVERMFDGVGVAVRVELATLAEPTVGELLARRGYVLEGFEHVLGRSLPAPDLERVAPDVEVAESSADELCRWTDVVIEGFAHPHVQGAGADEGFPREALEHAFADMDAAPGFVRYLARRNGQLAGGAGLRLFDGIAQLCGAATLPAHRRRGVQSSLLAIRLAAAAAAGCDIAVVTTQPGSKSQQNVQRLGFDLLYARAVLVRQI